MNADVRGRLYLLPIQRKRTKGEGGQEGGGSRWKGSWVWGQGGGGQGPHTSLNEYPSHARYDHHYVINMENYIYI